MFDCFIVWFRGNSQFYDWFGMLQRFIALCVNVTIKNTYTTNSTWLDENNYVDDAFFRIVFDKFISFNQRQVIIFHCIWYYFNDELYDNSVCWNEWHKASITNKIMFVLILSTVCWLPKLKIQTYNITISNSLNC